ncbi:MAG: type II toxin-antitoxin system prevent-host-death family antitoxin [Parvularculaceae bacterium]
MSESVFTAKAAKNRFGEVLDAAQRRPVTIVKHGRPFAVVLSHRDFEEARAARLALLKIEIERGASDLKAGIVHDSRSFFQRLKELRL